MVAPSVETRLQRNEDMQLSFMLLSVLGVMMWLGRLDPSEGIFFKSVTSHASKVGKPVPWKIFSSGARGKGSRALTGFCHVCAEEATQIRDVTDYMDHSAKDCVSWKINGVLPWKYSPFDGMAWVACLVCVVDACSILISLAFASQRLFPTGHPFDNKFVVGHRVAVIDHEDLTTDSVELDLRLSLRPCGFWLVGRSYWWELRSSWALYADFRSNSIIKSTFIIN